MTAPNQGGSTLFWIRINVIARYRQKPASPSAICPSSLCVFVRRAICPSSISVAIPARKTSRANPDGVLTPPTNLPSKNEATKPRSHVKLLATPTVGKSLPVPTCRFNPRCQKRSLCCHATQNRKPGSRRSAVCSPSKMKLAASTASASTPINSVMHVQERFSDGLALAVAQDISHERWRKCIHASGLNLSLRRVVSRSTTNWFSLSNVWVILENPLEGGNVSRETFSQGLT